MTFHEFLWSMLLLVFIFWAAQLAICHTDGAQRNVVLLFDRWKFHVWSIWSFQTGTIWQICVSFGCIDFSYCYVSLALCSMRMFKSCRLPSTLKCRPPVNFDTDSSTQCTQYTIATERNQSVGVEIFTELKWKTWRVCTRLLFLVHNFFACSSLTRMEKYSIRGRLKTNLWINGEPSTLHLAQKHLAKIGRYHHLFCQERTAEPNGSEPYERESE